MKDWKTLVIGFLLASVLFLCLGAAGVSPVGTHQISITMDQNSSDIVVGVINTASGHHKVTRISVNDRIYVPGDAYASKYYFR